MSTTPVGSVFEIVDSTSDEQYWTLGMFPTLADAMAALDGCTPKDIPGDHDEYEGACRVEIREHKYGWGGTGKCVCACEWTTEYNEATDEYEWRIANRMTPDERQKGMVSSMIRIKARGRSGEIEEYAVQSLDGDDYGVGCLEAAQRTATNASAALGRLLNWMVEHNMIGAPVVSQIVDGHMCDKKAEFISTETEDK